MIAGVLRDGFVHDAQIAIERRKPMAHRVEPGDQCGVGDNRALRIEKSSSAASMIAVLLAPGCVAARSRRAATCSARRTVILRFMAAS
jgi:hypothetical protein